MSACRRNGALIGQPGAEMQLISQDPPGRLCLVTSVKRIRAKPMRPACRCESWERKGVLPLAPQAGQRGNERHLITLL